jgi:hypothetical protein
MVRRALLAPFELDVEVAHGLRQLPIAPLESMDATLIAQDQAIARVYGVVEGDQTLERLAAQGDPASIANLDVPGFRLLVETEESDVPAILAVHVNPR